MASMRDIKRRKGSVSSTQQITKAMKLVSTVKLQKARLRAENAKPYFQYMYQTMSSILRRSGNINHPYLVPGDSDKKAVVAITSNRGLAGGYNSNIVKLIANSDLKKEDVVVYALGRKGKDGLIRRGYEIKEDYSDVMEEPSYADAAALCRKLLEDFEAGEIGEIYLAYTDFKNTVSQVPKMLKLLPVEVEENEESDEEMKTPMNFEPSEEEALDMMIPKYISSILYGAFNEAVASENGARMQAMDSATSNAEEIIQELSLKYNRARQGAITQELTEIIAGAEAIS